MSQTVDLSKAKTIENGPSTVDLSKGGNIQVAADGETQIAIGMGWDEYKGEGNLDGDLFAFFIGEDGKAGEIVYFGHRDSDDGSIHLSEDNQTGEGDGDDEIMSIDFSKVSDDVKKIVIGANIYDAVNRGFNFGIIGEDAYVRVIGSDLSVLTNFELAEDYAAFTGVLAGEVYRRPDGSWKFRALGQGVNGDLNQIKADYNK